MYLLKNYSKYLITVCFILLLYLFKDIISPFVISILIAYIFNPLRIKLNFWLKYKTLSATIIITCISFGFIIIFTILLPIIYGELNNLINLIIKYSSNIKFNDFIFIKNRFSTFDVNIQNKISELFSDASAQIFKSITKIASSLLNSSISILNFLANILLIPIISFYFIRDYDDIKLKFNQLIRSELFLLNNDVLNSPIKNIDLIIKTYLSRQAVICLLMIGYYFISLKILGIEYVCTIALISGLLVAIPYLGFIISLSLALLISLAEAMPMIDLLIIIIIYLVGQITESNFITPKLIGDKLDLHPVLIIFAITFFGNIFGLTGAIIAIPLAAIIKFLISDFYRYLTQKV